MVCYGEGLQWLVPRLWSQRLAWDSVWRAHSAHSAGSPSGLDFLSQLSTEPQPQSQFWSLYEGGGQWIAGLLTASYLLPHYPLKLTLSPPYTVHLLCLLTLLVHQHLLYFWANLPLPVLPPPQYFPASSVN